MLASLGATPSPSAGPYLGLGAIEVWGLAVLAIPLLPTLSRIVDDDGLYDPERMEQWRRQVEPYCVLCARAGVCIAGAWIGSFIDQTPWLLVAYLSYRVVAMLILVHREMRAVVELGLITTVVAVLVFLLRHSLAI